MEINNNIESEFNDLKSKLLTACNNLNETIQSNNNLRIENNKIFNDCMIDYNKNINKIIENLNNLINNCVDISNNNEGIKLLKEKVKQLKNKIIQNNKN